MEITMYSDAMAVVNKKSRVCPSHQASFVSFLFYNPVFVGIKQLKILKWIVNIAIKICII